MIKILGVLGRSLIYFHHWLLTPCTLHLLLIACEYKLCEWFQIINLNWASECDSLIVGENWRAGLLCCKCCKWSSWELETACESQKTKRHWCCHHRATQLTHVFFDCCWWLGSTEINVGRTPQRVVQNVQSQCQIGTGFVSAPLAGVMPKQSNGFWLPFTQRSCTKVGYF